MPQVPCKNLKYAMLTVLLTAQVFSCALAGSVSVEVLGPDGGPVPEVAVYVTYEKTSTSSQPGTAVMDQVDTRFVPHILVVQKGTSVEFPNSDVVAHHVYSFSKPNNFVLPLYKGDPHDPVTFEHDGIVTLGCNIHDHMLAYIIVVDTDAFGVTDDTGRLNVDVDDTLGAATVNIWSPRIRDKELSKSVGTGSATITFSLQKKLRPPHDSDSEAVQWSEY
jgi:plastocyanin